MKKKLFGWSYVSSYLKKFVPEITWVSLPGGTNTAVFKREFRSNETNVCLVSVRYRDLPELSKRNFLKPLDHFFSKKELSIFLPQSVELCRHDGRLLAIPEDIFPFGLMLWKDQLDQENLQIPKTWAELENQLKYFSEKRDTSILDIPGRGIQNRLGFVQALIASNGISIRNDLNAVMKQEKELTEVYDWIFNLCFKKKYIDSSGFTNFIHIGSRDSFVSKELIYLFTWLSRFDQISESELEKVHFVHFPHGLRKNMPEVPVGGLVWCIPGNSSEPDTAIKCLRNLVLGDYFYESTLKGGYVFSARTDIWQDRKILKKWPYFRFASNLLSDFKLIPSNSRNPDQEFLVNSFQKTFSQGKSGQEWIYTLNNKSSDTGTQLVNNRFVIQAIEYLKNNLKHIHNMEEVAENINISRDYLDRLFNKELSMSVGTYWKKVRMEKARELLFSYKKSIKEISHEVGYQDANSFSRAFQKYWGKSPVNLRNPKEDSE